MSAGALSDITCGAKFYRADLHIHSLGASFDVTDTTATVENIISTAVSENLSMIAITDHNEILNVRAAVNVGAAAGILVIPGVELSTPEGHLLCYAPTVEHLERFFNRVDIADRGANTCRCTTGMKQCLDLIGAEGGFGVIAHIESRGSFEEKFPTSTPAKLDVLCHNHLLAISRQERADTRKGQIMSQYDDKLQAFLEFVLGQYVQEGVGELDREKLPHLLELKYQAVSDAAEKLGGVARISEAFVGFQKHLY